MTRVQKVILCCCLGCTLACGAPAKDTAYQSPQLSESEKQWTVAHDLERKGDAVGARNRYRQQCEGELQYKRSCYDYCRLLFDSGEVEKGRSCSRQFFSIQSDHALAPVLAKAYAASYKKSGMFLEGASAMGQLAGDVEGTDVWDSLQYQSAVLSKKAGDTANEEAALMAIVQKGRWGSQLWDNAIWRAIEIKREKGDGDAEEQLLLEMLSARESSKLIASYHSPYYDDALFRLGKLYWEKGDFEQAFDAFIRLSKWDTSRMRDDALFACAQLKKEIGEYGTACKLLSHLLDTMPESSSYRKAQKTFMLWECK